MLPFVMLLFTAVLAESECLQYERSTANCIWLEGHTYTNYPGCFPLPGHDLQLFPGQMGYVTLPTYSGSPPSSAYLENISRDTTRNCTDSMPKPSKLPAFTAMEQQLYSWTAAGAPHPAPLTVNSGTMWRRLRSSAFIHYLGLLDTTQSLKDVKGPPG